MLPEIGIAENLNRMLAAHHCDEQLRILVLCRVPSAMATTPGCGLERVRQLQDLITELTSRISLREQSVHSLAACFRWSIASGRVAFPGRDVSFRLSNRFHPYSWLSEVRRDVSTSVCCAGLNSESPVLDPRR